jgi:hypothetical protein
MLDLLSVTADDFRPALNQIFRAQEMDRQDGVAPETLSLTLTAVEERDGPGLPNSGQRNAFVLVFVCAEPAGSPVGILCTLSNDTVGTLEVVNLVPNSGLPHPDGPQGQLWSATFG